MPLSDRDYMREKHPPACTCVACARKRAARLSRKPLWKRLLGKIFPWVK